MKNDSRLESKIKLDSAAQDILSFLKLVLYSVILPLLKAHLIYLVQNFAAVTFHCVKAAAAAAAPTLDLVASIMMSRTSL